MSRLLPALLLSIGLILPATTPAQSEPSDTALLLAPEAPPAGTQAGHAALWLYHYDFPSAEHPRLMRQYGHILQTASSEIPAELAARELIPQPDPSLRHCLGLSTSTADCITQVRRQLPQYQADNARRQKLLANIYALAEHRSFAPPDWPNNKQGMPGIAFPHYAPILQARTHIITVWHTQGAAAALPLACRQMHTARTLISTARPGLLSAVMGTALANDSLDLTAHLLAEQPALARQLPAECHGVFQPLPDSELTLCRAMRDEFRLLHNEQQKSATGYLKTNETSFAQIPNNSPAPDKRETKDHRFTNTAPSLTRTAAELAPYCRADTTAILAQDRPFLDPPVAGNQPQPHYSAYVRRMQDLQMRLHAVQALLDIYRLPEAERRPAAIRAILNQHSTPARRLTWNHARHHLSFPLYERRQQTRYPPHLPFRPDAD